MPSQIEVDQGMYEQGYRYRLVPKDADFRPLYAKTLAEIGPLMRSWKDVHFDVTPLRNDWKLSDLAEKWRENKQLEVIDILANEHPGLTALFLVTGIADKTIDRLGANTIANLLGDLRQKEFPKLP